MFAPAPPRCWTRSSTRNDSETFSISPSTNCSAKRPGKVIRWSVAIEPVTTTGTAGSLDGDAAAGSVGGLVTGQNAAPSRGPAFGLCSGGGHLTRSRQHTAQPKPQLQGPHHTEHGTHGRAHRDDERTAVHPRQDPRPAQGEAGHR